MDDVKSQMSQEGTPVLDQGWVQEQPNEALGDVNSPSTHQGQEVANLRVVSGALCNSDSETNSPPKNATEDWTIHSANIKHLEAVLMEQQDFGTLIDEQRTAMTESNEFFQESMVSFVSQLKRMEKALEETLQTAVTPREPPPPLVRLMGDVCRYRLELGRAKTSPTDHNPRGGNFQSDADRDEEERQIVEDLMTTVDRGQKNLMEALEAQKSSLAQSHLSLGSTMQDLENHIRSTEQRLLGVARMISVSLSERYPHTGTIQQVHAEFYKLAARMEEYCNEKSSLEVKYEELLQENKELKEKIALRETQLATVQSTLKSEVHKVAEEAARSTHEMQKELAEVHAKLFALRNLSSCSNITKDASQSCDKLRELREGVEEIALSVSRIHAPTRDVEMKEYEDRASPCHPTAPTADQNFEEMKQDPQAHHNQLLSGHSSSPTESLGSDAETKGKGTVGTDTNRNSLWHAPGRDMTAFEKAVKRIYSILDPPTAGAGGSATRTAGGPEEEKRRSVYNIVEPVEPEVEAATAAETRRGNMRLSPSPEVSQPPKMVRFVDTSSSDEGGATSASEPSSLSQRRKTSIDNLCLPPPRTSPADSLAEKRKQSQSPREDSADDLFFLEAIDMTKALQLELAKFSSQLLRRSRQHNRFRPKNEKINPAVIKQTRSDVHEIEGELTKIEKRFVDALIHSREAPKKRKFLFIF